MCRGVGVWGWVCGCGCVGVWVEAAHRLDGRSIPSTSNAMGQSEVIGKWRIFVDAADHI